MRTVLIRFFLLLVVLGAIVARPATVAAQESYLDQSHEQIKAGWDRGRVSGQVNLEAMQKLGFTVLPSSLICWSVGDCSNMPDLQAKFRKESAISYVGSSMLAMYVNPPANTGVWLADVGQSLGFLPKQAYAQSTGFDGLRPLLKLWRGFRNIAYLMMTVILIIIGFMVMFRRRIDPKTVVTVQDALPRIVITLILVTFSYAIAAFMIDLLYLLMLLSLSVIGSSGIDGLSFATLREQYMGGDLGQLFSATFAPLDAFNPAGTGGTIGGILGFGLGLFAGANPLVAILGAIAGNAIGNAVQSGSFLGLLNPFLYVIFAIALLFGFLRIFFMLLGAYIQIILAVVLGPIQIMLDALPGGEGFMSWLKNLFSNIIVFPITITLLALGAAISQNITADQPLWIAPFLPAFTADIARGLIGLGITLTTPSIVNGIKESFKAKSPIPAAAGAGGAFGILGTAGRMGVEHWMRGRQLRHLRQGGQDQQLSHERPPGTGLPRS